MESTQNTETITPEGVLFIGDTGVMYTEDDYQKYMFLNRYSGYRRMNRKQWFDAMEDERKKGIGCFVLSSPKK